MNLKPGDSLSVATASGKVACTFVSVDDRWLHARMQRGDDIYIPLAAVHGVVHIDSRLEREAIP